MATISGQSILRFWLSTKDSDIDFKPLEPDIIESLEITGMRRTIERTRGADKAGRLQAIKPFPRIRVVLDPDVGGDDSVQLTLVEPINERKFLFVVPAAGSTPSTGEPGLTVYGDVEIESSDIVVSATDGLARLNVVLASVGTLWTVQETILLVHP